jgi:hypothetical protein
LEVGGSWPVDQEGKERAEETLMIGRFRNGDIATSNTCNP